MPRLFDIAFACLALIALAPLMSVIAIAIRWGGSGPILFRQNRVGHNGRTFVMVKFRSLDHDRRPTKVGRVLRRYSLDELPEFWNVLRGDMAVVGPRPLIEAEQPAVLRLRRLRQRIRPGITGLAQVSGRNALAFEKTFQLDLFYGRHRSALMDLYILAATLPCVLFGKGACALAEGARPKSRPVGKSVQLAR